MATRDDLGGGGRPTSKTTPQTANRTTGKPPLGQEGGSEPEGSVAHQAKEQVKNLASEAREQTSHLAGQAKDQVGNLVAQQKDQAAERLGSFAGALREAASKLNEQDAGGFGHYADRAAEKVDRLSQYLREKDLHGFLDDAERFARRRPDLFLGGTFFAGLLAARFLKASGERTHEGYSSAARASRGPARSRTEWGGPPVGTGTTFGPGGTTYGTSSTGGRPAEPATGGL